MSRKSRSRRNRNKKRENIRRQICYEIRLFVRGNGRLGDRRADGPRDFYLTITVLTYNILGIKGRLPSRQEQKRKSAIINIDWFYRVYNREAQLWRDFQHKRNAERHKHESRQRIAWMKTEGKYREYLALPARIGSSRYFQMEKRCIRGAHPTVPHMPYFLGSLAANKQSPGDRTRSGRRWTVRIFGKSVSWKDRSKRRKSWDRRTRGYVATRLDSL